MFSRLTRLTLFELKAAATRNRNLPDSWRHVTIDVHALSLADALTALPVLDGTMSSGTTVELAGQPVVRELFEDHFRARGHGIGSGDRHLVLTLVPETGATFVESTGTQTAITLGPDCGGVDWQTSHLTWLRAALGAGLTPVDTLPRLQFTPAAARRARRWLRREVGVLTPPVAAMVSSRPYPEVVRAVQERVGVVAVKMTGETPATALLGFALCVGDDPDWTTLAASLGVPTLRINPHSDPDTPRARPGVELWHWGRPPRSFDVVRRRFEYSHDENPENIAVLGEHLAALRWPGDRLFRMLP